MESPEPGCELCRQRLPPGEPGHPIPRVLKERTKAEQRRSLLSILATACRDQALPPYFHVHPKVLALLPEVLPPRHRARAAAQVGKSVFIPPHPWGWM